MVNDLAIMKTMGVTGCVRLFLTHLKQIHYDYAVLAYALICQLLQEWEGFNQVDPTIRHRMNARNLTVGLLQHWVKCIPDSLETFRKCTTSPQKLHANALQTVSLGRRISFKFLDQVNSRNNFNGSFIDNSTLLGQLSVGLIDWIAQSATLTENRAEYIDYGIPTAEDNLCIFVGRKWLSSGMFKKQLSIPWFRKASFGFAGFCFALFYNNNLKADFMPKTDTKLPFKTVQELAELVRADQYYLVLDGTDDYRMEMIRNSGSAAMRALNKALSPDKVKIVGSSYEIWEKLHQARGAFTVNSLYDFLRMNQSKMHNFVKVCPKELPGFMNAYGFPKKSKLVDDFNRHAQFVYVLWLKSLKSLEARHVYYVSADVSVVNRYNQLVFVNTIVLFRLHFGLLLCCVLFCCGEVVWLRVKTKSWTIPV